MDENNGDSSTPVEKNKFTPREYQIEIIDKSIKDNVIVFLPTGSGKTFIAVKVIEHFSNEFDLNINSGGKRAFFLVNTVALVSQQAKAVSSTIPFKVGKYCGYMGVDYWDLAKWTEEFNSKHVLVMTAQIFLDLVNHKYIHFDQISLLIFDECHHGGQNHPMKLIMNEYDLSPQKPRIVGLTATLLNANITPQKVKKEIRTLEETFNAKVVQATNHDMVLQFSTNPNESLVFYDVHEDDDTMRHIIDNLTEIEEYIKYFRLPDEMDLCSPCEIVPNAFPLFENGKTIAKKLINYVSDLIVIAKDIGMYGASKAILSKIVLLETFKLSADTTTQLAVEIITTKLTCLRKFILDVMQKEGGGENVIYEYSSEKFRKLIDVIRSYPTNSAVLVFVDRRSMAQCLHHIFMDLAKLPSNNWIKSDFIVGVNNTHDVASNERKYRQKSDMIILQRFAKKEINVLFASNVVEEGIDVRTCNFVIKFDIPVTFRSYIQSKGRARHPQSKYVVFAKSDFIAKYNQYQEVENILKGELIDNDFLNDSDKDEDDDTSYFYQINGPNGPKITALSAISLINRYCSCLPQDKFAKLTVNWWCSKLSDGRNSHKFIAYLRLPINCPIKTLVESPPRATKLSAKRLAALDACMQLHALGELNDYLLPVENELEILNDPNVFPKWRNESSSVKPGTKNNKRIYKKHCPVWLSSCLPVAKKLSYLHLLSIKPCYKYPETDRLRTFYNLLDSGKSFAIITSVMWPQICSFPLFLNVGEVEVNVHVNARSVKLSEEEIGSLCSFQCFLFTSVLQIVKGFLTKSSKNKENSFLIAPVIFEDGKVSIDWDLINGDHIFPEIKPKPFGKRLETAVNDDFYLNKVVVPWYRPPELIQNYIVTKVQYKKNPATAFPTANFSTFADYFQKKYNVEVFDSKQPLIEVRAITKNITFTKPRSTRGKKADDEALEETFIPELCHLLNFPAVYCLKASLLPTAIHRISHILSCEELREKIAKSTGMGPIKTVPGFTWTKLAANPFPSVNEKFEDITPSEIVNFRKQILKEDSNIFDVLREIDDTDYSSIIHFHQSVSQQSPSENYDDEIDFVTFVNPLKEPPKLTILDKRVNNLYGPELSEVVTALTASSSDDIINYERLEMLGDSFLKFAASLAVFMQYSTKDEGKLTLIKSKTIGNANLFYCGEEELAKRLKVNAFDANNWKPPGFSVLPVLDDLFTSGKLNPSCLDDFSFSPEERDGGFLLDTTVSQINQLLPNILKLSDGETFLDRSSKDDFIGRLSVPDKNVSDCVEALLCVYIKAFGLDGGLKLLEWLGVMPSEMCSSAFLFHSLVDSPLIDSSIDPNMFLCLPDELEKSLGYKFNDRAFLLQALSHPSATHNATDCYQRLEFLGDALLDFLITSHIYDTCSTLSPGKLTDLRSALVNNVTFACLSVRYNFHLYLVSLGCELNDIVQKFARCQEENNHTVDAKVIYLINETDTRVTSMIDVPKVLGDIFESLAGAVYLDSGKNIQTVWKVFYNLMEKEIVEFSKNIPLNAVRVLHEKFQPEYFKFGKTEFFNKKVIIPLEVFEDSGVQMVFHGYGDNKYQAKIAAAKAALKHYKFV